jgi:PAS domain-containing protein
MGRPFREVRAENWPAIAPLVDQALAGEANWAEDMHLVMERTATRRRPGTLSPTHPSAADHAPMLTRTTGPDGQRIQLNRRWYEFTGQLPGTGEGSGWLDAMHPEGRPGAAAGLRGPMPRRRLSRPITACTWRTATWMNSKQPAEQAPMQRPRPRVPFVTG